MFLLWEVVSDQYGTSRLVGVFSTEDKAQQYAAALTERRNYISEVPLDPVPPMTLYEKMLRLSAQLETERRHGVEPNR